MGEPLNTESDFIESKLLELLLAPDPSSPEWQKEIAGLVGQAWVRASDPETSDGVALDLYALIVEASRAGSKDAQKRTLKTSRFANQPAGIEAVLSPESQSLGHLEMLSKVKASWCPSFIAGRLRLGALSKSSLDLYLKWTMRNSSDTAELLGVFVFPLLDSKVDEALKIQALKLFERSLPTTYTNDPIAESSTSIRELIAWLKADGLATKTGKQVMLLLQRQLRRLQAQPHLLLHGSVLVVLGSGITSLPNKVRQGLATVLVDISRTITSLIESVLTYSDQTGRIELHKILPLLNNAIPMLAQELKLASRTSDGLKAFLEGVPSGPLEDDTGAIDLIADMLVRRQSLGELSCAALLDAYDRDLAQLAEAVNLHLMGSVGEELFYDPLRHRLTTDAQGSSPLVKIVQPGVYQVRTNGSVRVLHMAIANPVM